MARTETNRLIQMISDGVVSSEQVVTMCMKYMSEDDVADMVDCNELSERFEEPEVIHYIPRNGYSPNG